MLGDLGVEIVHEHALRGFGALLFAVRSAPRGAWIGLHGRPPSVSSVRDAAARAISPVSTSSSVDGFEIGTDVAIRTRSGDARASHRVADRGCGGPGQRRAQVQRPAPRDDLDREDTCEAVDRAAKLARTCPSHRDVVPLHSPTRGSESTDAGIARRLSSDTMPAAAYCAIMRPESTPTSSARNGGRPLLRVRSRARSVRRLEMDATSATGIARKSRTYATGAPWKLPLDSTRPSEVTTGLSTADASSRDDERGL